MIGLLIWDNLPLYKINTRQETLLGLEVLCLHLSDSPTLLSYRLRRVGRMLAQHGVRKMLVPEGFAHWPMLHPWGLHPVAVLPTLQALAGDIFLAWLSAGKIDPRESIVCLLAPGISPAISQVAEQLAPQVAQLILPPVPGCSQLQQSLFLRYGLAPCSHRNRHSATLCFGEGEWTDSWMILQFQQIDASGFCKLRLKKGEIPPHFPYLPTLALLSSQVNFIYITPITTKVIS